MDTLRRLTREEFVALHRQPLLEQLRHGPCGGELGLELDRWDV